MNFSEALKDLLHHQAAVLAARADAHSPDGATRLRALAADTPRLARRVLAARAQLSFLEYMRAAALLGREYGRLVALNKLIERLGDREASIVTADLKRLYIPAFNVPRTEEGRYQDALLSAVALEHERHNFLESEIRELTRLGIQVDSLTAAPRNERGKA